MVIKIHLHICIVNVLNISSSQRLLHLSQQSCGERSSEAWLLSLRQVESGAKQATPLLLMVWTDKWEIQKGSIVLN